MSEFPKQFTEIFERQPNQLRERFLAFSDEQGYTIAEIDGEERGFAFQVLNEDLTVADKSIQEVFRKQFCLLDGSVTEENLLIKDDAGHGTYLFAEAKY